MANVGLIRVLLMLAAILTAPIDCVADPLCTPVQYAQVKPPRYPPGAIAARASGKTILLLTVALDGTPQDIEVDTTSGNADLDAAAQEQVSRWRFQPSRCEGKAVASKVKIPVDFHLSNDIPDVPWEVVPDLEIMEKATVPAQLSYLRSRSDLERRSNDHGRYASEAFYDVDGEVIWIATYSNEGGGTQIGRLRMQIGPHVFKGFYATLCDGSAGWCSALSANQIEAFKVAAPPPPPPRPPPPKTGIRDGGG